MPVRPSPESSLSRTQSRVVVIGDALIDEIRADGVSREFVGGAGLNVAIGLSKLGTDVTLLAMVGNDADGEMIRAALAQYDVQLIASPSRNGTSRAISSRISGEPVYTFNQAAKHRHIRFADQERTAIHEAAAVVVSCFPFDDQSQLDGLADSIAASEAPLVIDPNPRPGMLNDRATFVRNFERLAARSRLVKISEDDAGLLYGESVERSSIRMLATGAAAVLTTLGSRGASLATREGITVRAPIAQLPEPIIDTMGAGDATLASIVNSLAAVGTPEDAFGWNAIVTRAMEAAAATCRHEGGQLRLPTTIEHG